MSGDLHVPFDLEAGACRVVSDGRTRSTYLECLGHDGRWVRLHGTKYLAFVVRPNRVFTEVHVGVSDVAINGIVRDGVFVDSRPTPRERAALYVATSGLWIWGVALAAGAFVVIPWAIGWWQ